MEEIKGRQAKFDCIIMRGIQNMKAYHLMGKSPYFTNCYMICDDKGDGVLIDCSAEINKVKSILENDMVQLKAVLLTHGHKDHVETLAELRSEFSVPVYLGEADAELFAIEGTTPYTDLSNLEFGDIKIFTIATPGHTLGGYCLKCEDMLFTGDTLFAGTVGRTDLEGGDYDTLMASLKKLKEFVKSDLKVLPGHNHFSTMEQERAQNPYLKK
ncbi:MAG: MBL fold metallo-hydrolase [Oscillospiraceae bacterium]